MLAYALFPSLPYAILAYSRAQDARGRRPLSSGLAFAMLAFAMPLFAMLS